MNKINDLKFSFVHLDFDLYQSTVDTFNFIKDRLEKNAILCWRLQSYKSKGVKSCRRFNWFEQGIRLKVDN